MNKRDPGPVSKKAVRRASRYGGAGSSASGSYQADHGPAPAGAGADTFPVKRPIGIPFTVMLDNYGIRGGERWTARRAANEGEVFSGYLAKDGRGHRFDVRDTGEVERRLGELLGARLGDPAEGRRYRERGVELERVMIEADLFDIPLRRQVRERCREDGFMASMMLPGTANVRLDSYPAAVERAKDIAAEIGRGDTSAG